MGVGTIGAFIAGLLGVGGGIIFVPALIWVAGMIGYGDSHAMHLALGTSMAIIAFTGAVAAYHHFKGNNLDMATVRASALFLWIGVGAGMAITAVMDGDVLKKIFGGVVFLLGIYMLLPPLASTKKPLPDWMLKSSYILIGGLSALLGIGGALLTVPLLTRQSFPMQRAIGTGAALAVVIALPATLGYIFTGAAHTVTLPPFSFGYVNALALAVIAPLALLIIPIGVRTAKKTPPQRLKKIFAAFLFLVSLKMLLT